MCPDHMLCDKHLVLYSVRYQMHLPLKQQLQVCIMTRTTGVCVSSSDAIVFNKATFKLPASTAHPLSTKPIERIRRALCDFRL